MQFPKFRLMFYLVPVPVLSPKVDARFYIFRATIVRIFCACYRAKLLRYTIVGGTALYYMDKAASPQILKAVNDFHTNVQTGPTAARH